MEVQMRTAACALAAVAAVWVATPIQAVAQQWPDKPVRILVPFPPGGGTDIQARLLSVAFQKSMGQNFIIDNRTGAGGLIAGQLAVDSPPDGNTILFTSGRLSVAVTTPKRASALPDLPTMNSMYPGFESDNWYAMFYPKGTPKPIVDKMNAEIRKALDTPEIKAFMPKEALDPVASKPEELSELLKREIEKYAKVIRLANI